MSWQIFEGELDHDDVRSLLDQHFTEMRAGSPPEACHVLPIDGLRAAGIRFFTVRDGGTLLGCGALKRLKADSRTADVPVLALSAQCSSPTAAAVTAAGADAFLAKPCDPDVLLEHIRTAMRKLPPR